MDDSKAVRGPMHATSGSVRYRQDTQARIGIGPEHHEQLQHAIAVAAYYASERRNFQAGHELEDWLQAEAEVRAEVESWSGFPA